MTNYKAKGYGIFLQDGGEMGMQMSADQQMAAEQQMQAPESQEDPQAIAEEFLQAFSQLPPEAQQLIAQAISQPQ